MQDSFGIISWSVVVVKLYVAKVSYNVMLRYSYLFIGKTQTVINFCHRGRSIPIEKASMLCKVGYVLDHLTWVKPGNTKGGSIIVQLTSC